MSATSASLSVILIHGAFTNSSCWSKVLLGLRARGIRGTATHCPLTSLTHDAAAAQRAIEMQAGHVLLVGHGWGGVAISEAGRHPKVAGLVYVAGIAPDSGQSFNDWSRDYPLAPGCAEVTPFGDGFVALTAKGFREDFAPDVAAEEADALFATQAPLAMRYFGDRVGKTAWRMRSASYLVAEDDRMIPPALEHASASGMGGRVLNLRSSHVPMLSQPEAVTDFVAQAIEGLTG